MRVRYPLAAIAALGIALLALQVRASCFFDSTLFAPASPLLSGVGALEGAAVADLNGDGIPDIAFAPGGVTSYRFLLANTTAGKWNGTFTPVTGPSFLGAGVGGHGLASGDLNHDGKPDLVTFEGQFLVGLLSPPSGTIAGGTPNRANMAFNGLQPRLFDFDRDGFLDVAVARGTTGVSVVKGASAPPPFGYQFVTGAVVTFATGGTARDVAAGDLDHDGALDMVVATTNTDVVILPGLVDARGIPTGGFGAARPLTVTTAGRETWDAVVADLDEDGWDDIAVAVRAPSGPSSIVVLLNQGDGTFGPPIAYDVNGAPKSLLALDVDKDGTLDIVAAGTGGATLSLLHGQRSGPPNDYVLLPPIPVGSPVDGTMLAAGDIDNDGANEIVVPGLSSVLLHSGCLPGTYSILRAVSGHGRVDRTFGSGSLAGAGDFVRLSAFPQPEYHFIGWFGDTTTSASNQLSFTASRNRTYRAAFSKNEYVLNVTIDVAGTVSRDPDLPTYLSGTVVTLTETPDVGSTFVNWSGDASGPNVSVSVTMVGVNKNVTAHFASMFVPLTVSVVGNGRVLRTPDRVDHPLNSTVTLDGIPDDGFLFDHWSGDLAGTAHPQDLVMNTAKSVTATFAVDARSPRIRAVRDLPADEGGRVKLEWLASSLDALPVSPSHIGSYLVFREVPTALARAALLAGRAHLLDPDATGLAAGATYLHTVEAAGDFFWEYLVTVPAAAFPGYSVVAPTTLDSTATSTAWTRFKLQARSNDGLSWFNSAPDSGHSIDNLAPRAPAPLSLDLEFNGNELHWRANTEVDLASYRVFRGSTPEFVPGPVTLAADVIDTTFLDPTTGSAWYKVVAVDVHGNESVASAVFASRTTDTDNSPPTRLAITASPNPGPGRTVFTLSLPSAAHVRVKVLDAGGRLIAGLIDDERPAGRTSLVWSGRDERGRPVAGGLYFALVEAGGTRVVTRVVLLQ